MIEDKAEENKKKLVWIREEFHKDLKIRAIVKGTSLEEEMDKILVKELRK